MVVANPVPAFRADPGDISGERVATRCTLPLRTACEARCDRQPAARDHPGEPRRQQDQGLKSVKRQSQPSPFSRVICLALLALPAYPYPMRFTKMHGLGNDYIYINGFAEKVDDPSALSRKIS